RNSPSHQAFLSRWQYRRDFDLLRIRETADRGRIDLEVAAEDVAQAVKRKPRSVEVLLAAAELERLRGRKEMEDSSRTVQERRQGLQQHRDRAMGFLERGLDLVKKEATGDAEYSRFKLLWHKANLLLDDLDRAHSYRDEDARPD